MPVTKISPNQVASRPASIESSIAEQPECVARAGISTDAASLLAPTSIERDADGEVSTARDDDRDQHRDGGHQHGGADRGLRVEPDDPERAVVDGAEGERPQRDRARLVGGAEHALDASPGRVDREGSGATAAPVVRAALRGRTPRGRRTGRCRAQDGLGVIGDRGSGRGIVVRGPSVIALLLLVPAGSHPCIATLSTAAAVRVLSIWWVCDLCQDIQVAPAGCRGATQR